MLIYSDSKPITTLDIQRPLGRRWVAHYRLELVQRRAYGIPSRCGPILSSPTEPYLIWRLAPLSFRIKRR